MREGKGSQSPNLVFLLFATKVSWHFLKSEGNQYRHFTEPVTAVGNWATKARDGQQARVTCLRVIPTKGKKLEYFTQQLASVIEKHCSDSLGLKLESTGVSFCLFLFFKS